MRNKRNILFMAIVGAVAVIVVVFALVRAVAGNGNGTSLDPGLKATADRMLPVLNRPGRNPVTDATLRSFQAWVYNVQAQFAKQTAHESGPRHEQLFLSNPSVMPPQGVPISEPSHPFIASGSGPVTQAIQTGQGQYSTERVNSQDFRMYIVSLQVPSALRPAGATGVLEVVQPQS